MERGAYWRGALLKKGLRRERRLQKKEGLIRGRGFSKNLTKEVWLKRSLIRDRAH